MEEAGGSDTCLQALIFNMKKDHIRNALMDSKVTFFILPTKEIKEHIIKCDDEDVNGLPSDLKAIFLQDQGLAVENKMIADYMDGLLDKKNTKILAMCEVRVLQDRVPVI